MLGSLSGDRTDPPWKGMLERPPPLPPSHTVKQSPRLHGALCRLMVEGGAVAMREVFNQIHPPPNLRLRLSKIQVMKTLERLRNKGVIQPAQWAVLYPKAGEANSGHFDNLLLHILLRNICHLSPPYPNSWDGAPLVDDNSTAANLVRMDSLRHTIRGSGCIEQEEFYSLFEETTEVLCSIGGNSIRMKAEEIAEKQLDELQLSQFVQYLGQWDSEVERNKTSAEQPQSGHPLLLPAINLRQIVDTASDKRTATPDYTEAQPHTARGASTQEITDIPGKLQVPVTEQERGNSVTSGHLSSGVKKQGDFLPQDRTILIQYHKLLVEIRSNTVLPKLVKAGVLTHEEKNTINLATCNMNRMKTLLQLLPTKQRAAFGIFCEVIKSKDTSLYDTLVTAKRIAMEKPDDVTEASNSLRSAYKAAMARLTPVPWHPDAVIDIRDFYTSLYLTDHLGQEWTPESLFKVIAKQKSWPKGTRTVLEGVSGSGKSTVCRYITAEWAYSAGTARGGFHLVYYIEVKLLKNSIAETILEHNHDASYNYTQAELYTLIKRSQKDILFILDGLEDLAPKATREVMDLLHGHLFPNSSVLVTMNSTNMTDSLLKLFDRRIGVMGLSRFSQDEFVLQYAKLTKTPEELFVELINKVFGEDDESTSLQILSLNPQLLMCMCLLCETQCTLEAKSTTTLLQAFFYGLQKLYCKRNNVLVVDGVIPEQLQILAQDIEEMAWRCMHQNGSFFLHEQVEDEAGSAMYTLGILQRRASSALSSLQQLFFTNRIFQDFMVARVLCRLDPDDLAEHVDDLINNSNYSNVTQYFCGLLKNDYQTQRLSSVITGLAAINTKHWRRFTESTIIGSTGEMRDSQYMSASSEGRFGDFVLSLECLNECEGRNDMKKIVADSLPARIFTQHKKMVTHGAILGMTHVLRLDTSMVIEMEIRLDHFARYYTKTLAILGKAINQSKTLSELKIYWSDSDLLAEVFAVIFQAPCIVSTVSCFNETRQLKEHWVSAAVWSNMKQAGQNMASLKSFSFANCRNKAMVTCILHSITHTVECLSITNTTLDIVSAQELSKRIENAKSLRILDLTMVKINRPDFSYICAGLRLSSSLSQLILARTNMDVTSFITLTEALKFNRSLVKLDLRMTEMSDTACSALAMSVNSNRYIREIIMDGAKMTKDGKQILIEKTKKLNFVYVGIEAVEFVSIPSPIITTSKGSVYLPMLKPVSGRK